MIAKSNLWLCPASGHKDVTTDTTEIKRITRDYYEQIYSNKLDNLEEMNKFLEIYNLSRLNYGMCFHMGLGWWNKRMSSTSLLKTTKSQPNAIFNQMDWKLTKRYPTRKEKEEATSRGRMGYYMI